MRSVRLAMFLLFSVSCFAAIAEVQAPKNNNYACSGVTTCNYAFTSNVTSGNILVAAADVATQTLSITTTSGGTGCSGTTWTQRGTLTGPSGSLKITVWTGVASGTGACTVTVNSSASATYSISIAEYSGVDTTTPVDTSGTGSAANLTGTLSVTATGSTSQSGEFGIMFVASNSDSSAATATGWTQRVSLGQFNQTWTKSGISSGTTTSFSSTNYAVSGDKVAVLLTLQPTITGGGSTNKVSKGWTF